MISGGGTDDGINKLYMRYADIILMRAELENELNGPDAAAPWLTKIRERAFAPADYATEVTDYVTAASQSRATMFQAIVDERALEFAGEFIRKADLIRWGMLKKQNGRSKCKNESHRYTDRL
ncbi:MAG: RagB/SusD family nutrient uptake outer membrane protein [Bacteroides stercoris]